MCIGEDFDWHLVDLWKRALLESPSGSHCILACCLKMASSFGIGSFNCPNSLFPPWWWLGVTATVGHYLFCWYSVILLCNDLMASGVLFSSLCCFFSSSFICFILLVSWKIGFILIFLSHIVLKVGNNETPFAPAVVKFKRLGPAEAVYWNLRMIGLWSDKPSSRNSSCGHSSWTITCQASCFYILPLFY